MHNVAAPDVFTDLPDVLAGRDGPHGPHGIPFDLCFLDRQDRVSPLREGSPGHDAHSLSYTHRFTEPSAGETRADDPQRQRIK
jgi:hypothetical protein